MTEDFEEQRRRTLRLCRIGLWCAIAGNVAMVWFLIDHGSFAFAGNLSAIVVCAMALVIVRLRAESG